MEEQEILHAGREQLKFLNVRNRKKKKNNLVQNGQKRFYTI